MCQQGAARPYWKPRAKEGAALFGISHGFRPGSEGTPYPLPWQPKPAQEGRPPLENAPAAGALDASAIQSPTANREALPPRYPHRQGAAAPLETHGIERAGDFPLWRDSLRQNLSYNK